MKAVFIELPAFERHRSNYLNDTSYLDLQKILLSNPEVGDVIEGTGGLRKMRHGDVRRGKGKRGGLRVIYYWWLRGNQFWLFTIDDKNEMADLSADDRKHLNLRLKAEIESRRNQ